MEAIWTAIDGYVWWVAIIAAVAIGLWLNGLAEKARQERYHRYIDGPTAEVQAMRERVNAALAMPTSARDLRQLKAEVGQLKKEVTHAKRITYDHTKETNRSMRGTKLEARAKARWSSEQATSDLSRLTIDLDAMRVELDAHLTGR